MPMRAFRFPPFTLDVENTCLLHEGSRLSLSPKDFALLHHLVAHRGKVVPHAELMKAVWGDIAIGPDVLKARVRRLRRTLGDDASQPRFIASVHGEGYRFVARVVSSSLGADLEPPDAPPSLPMIGRDAELARLQELLAEAATGRRQLAFVTGEPGIGKTTLIDAFARRTNGAWTGRGQCIEHHGSGEPYLPVMEALARLARTEAHESLRAVLRRYAPSWLLELPALHEDGDREALERQALGLTRDRRLRELAEALEALSTLAFTGSDPPPLVLVLEDLHWTDPSTLDLLRLLAGRPDRARLLVVASYRSVAAAAPDHPLRPLLHELRAHSAITEIPLAPLREADVARCLDARFPGNAFASEIAPQLQRRTDGNPLFLTDVIRDLLAREVIVHTEAGWTFRGDAETFRSVVPASLRHLLEKQRDESSPAEQRLLEAASVAGLEFSAAAVAAALALPCAEVEEHGSRLAGRERFLRAAGVEAWPDGTEAARFGFRHALHRELWHEGIPASRRQEWHLRIAERKERAFGQRAPEIAAELALHFEHGRGYRRAVSYHEQASAHAFRRAANYEARAHLTRAFDLLQALDDTPARLPQELQLQLRLGTLLTMTEGYGAAGAGGAFRRAHEICRRLGDAPALFDALYGLLRFFWMRSELESARDLVAQLVQIAEQSQDPVRLMVTHLGLAQTHQTRGELIDALRHAKLGLELSRTHWNDSLLPVYGLHLGVVGAGQMANVLQLLGFPDQASQYCDELVEVIRGESHPLASAAAFWGVASFHHARGDAARLLESTAAWMRRPSMHGPGEFSPFLEASHGWALIVQGQPAPGLTCVRQAAEALRAIGATAFEPYVFGLLADGHRRVGEASEARTVLLEAFAAARRNGPGFYDAELHRLDGELRLEAEEAESCFRQALEVARQQAAKAWELRAALSLGELWHRQGKADSAHALVSETYAWFTEGFDTPDLKQARSFLEASP